MNEKVNNLLSCIDKYLDGKLSDNLLEQLTLDIIADDEFDSLKPEIQDAIYTLDSRQLNDLSSKDILELKRYSRL